MKPCSKCNKNLNLDLFYQRKSGTRSGEYYDRCKNCMMARGKIYYHLNHDRQLKLALVRTKKSYYKKRAIIESLKNVPCSDCGIVYPTCVMDFDHKDRSEKINSVSHMLRDPLDCIMKEISKCDIVCANCHRIRTYKYKLR